MSLSAQRIGELFGLNAQEMNMALKLLGYLDGEPGNYLPTEKCKPFYLQEYHDNGYGGYAKRIWRTVTVPSPKKQTKNVREKPNEKNDKYNIKLLNPTAFIPRFA